MVGILEECNGMEWSGVFTCYGIGVFARGAIAWVKVESSHGRIFAKLCSPVKVPCHRMYHEHRSRRV